jgi:hypothetical protein
MSQPSNDLLTEINEAISALHMAPSTIDDDEFLLVDRDEWVAHAVEHLRQARELISKKQ